MDLEEPLIAQWPRSASQISGGRPLGSAERRRSDQRRERLNTELLTAILDSNIDEVTRCLEGGASVDAVCRRSRTTAFQLAVVLGHLAIAKLLLAKGAKPRLRDRAGREAVHFAAAMGYPALLTLVLDADPASIDSRVGTTLDKHTPRDCLDSWAHDHDLITNKIPEIPRSATPLHIAAQRLHCDCVGELLRRGGRVNLRDDRGLTPLDVVGEEYHRPTNPPLVDFTNELTSFDADRTLTKIENMKKLMAGDPDQSFPKENDSIFSSKMNVMTALPFPPTETNPRVSMTSVTDHTSQAEKVACELINNGAVLPTSKVEKGEVINQLKLKTTCLHTAVERKDCHLVEYLLDHGACMVTWNSEGLTSLHLAVSKHLEGLLRIFLERDKSSQVVDSRDSQGHTPLHLAVAEEWCPGVSLLLEAGADVKVSSNNSETVLHIAARSSNPQLLEELLEIPESVKVLESRNNQYQTPLFCAAVVGNLPGVRLLTNRGADVSASLPGDITLLHVAAERGDSALLAELLQHPRMAAMRDIRTKETKGGTTALHLAVLGGFLDCVKLLVDTGCDLFVATTICPHFGSTALHLAAYRGHAKVVEYIVTRNRDTLSVKNADGWYPLHVAARFSKEESVRSMLLNGANLAATVSRSDGNLTTALEVIVHSILHPVEFLGEIFDSCIEVNEHPLNSPKCVVKVKHDLLQPPDDEQKQLKVLDSFLNCGKHFVQGQLLLHPLVETFLYLKWTKLRVFFLLMMALYVVFTVSLTTMSMIFYVLEDESDAANTCIHGSRVTLCSSLVFIIFQEMLQAARMRRYYVTDLESWLKWSGFLLATMVVLTPRLGPWMVHVSAIAVLLSWLELLFLLSRWPSSLGFYILMFFTVAKNVLRVLASFSFVILGFTFAFMIQFQAQRPFETWWESLVKVLVMTMEFDFNDLFENIQGTDARSVVGRSMFLLFMVLMAIVLMNLLIGLAVSDIATLEQQGRAQRLAKQIDFLSMLEVFVYNKPLFTWCPKQLSEAVKLCRALESYILVEPGKPLGKTSRFLPQELKQSIINNITKRMEKQKKTIQENESKFENAKTESESFSKGVETEKLRKNNLSVLSLEHLNNTLENIMKDLSLIKNDLNDIRRDSNKTEYQYQEYEPENRLLSVRRKNS